MTGSREQPGDAPKVSVIIPAYGMPHYLNQAIESVSRQTFTDYELLVVDDGSGDDVTRQYKLPERARLVPLSRHFGEPSGPRNAGFRESVGRYIAFLDQDDVWLPEKLERQVALIEASPEAGLVYCHFTRVDDNLVPLDKQARHHAVGPDPLRQLLDLCIAMSPTTGLVRREVLDDVGGFDESLGGGAEDWDLLIRIATRHSLRDDPTPMALYRIHPGQMTEDRLSMSRGHIRMLEKHLPIFRRDRPDLVGLLRRHLAHRYRQHADALLETKLDRRGAARALFTAMRVWPWRWEIYRRLAAVAFSALRAGRHN